MLNLNLMTERDRREAASIERRRSLEEERKKRIFNPRQRLIGVDNETLDRQIEEKKRRDAEEKRLSDVFKEQARKNDEIALELDRKEREERARIEREINNFRLCCQRREDRREFDLNDPNWIKKPVVVADEDVGPSAAQKFEGEDMVGVQRRQLQIEQTKAWLQQQIDEKHSAEQERKIADEAYKITLLTIDQRAVEMENLERECRQKLLKANQKFNKALMDEKKMLESHRHRTEQQDNMAEIYNCLTSDMLTENPDVNQSNQGPGGRKLATTYKGLTDQQKIALRKIQLQQIEEAKAKRELEKRSEREFAEYVNGIQKTIACIDHEEHLRRKDLTKQLAEENLRLAEEQRQRRLDLDRNVYKNIPSDEFYNQFNKTTR